MKDVFVSSKAYLDKPPKVLPLWLSNLLHNNLQSSEPWRLLVRNLWGRVAQYMFHLFYFHQLVLPDMLRCIKAWDLWPRSYKVLNYSQMPKTYCFVYETW